MVVVKRRAMYTLGMTSKVTPLGTVKVHDLRGRLVQLQRFRPNLVYNSMAAENHRVLMKEARYKWAKDVPGENGLDSVVNELEL